MVVGLIVGGRLIPARAGNILSSFSSSKADAAHPRSRGEHTAKAKTIHAIHGSSPLARGTFAQAVPSPFPLWLIPARAGNIRALRVFAALVPAHPRSRGEHSSAATKTPPPGGSSPLARGTCLRHPGGRAPHRLIPARAGNIPSSPCNRTRRAAHPRSRGEHFYRRGEKPNTLGSSPLARGTYSQLIKTHSRARLIPARAGNMVLEKNARSSYSAHPRSRGEHRISDASSPGRCGSSPLARGTFLAPFSVEPAARLIPARAGNMLWPWKNYRNDAAHPRSRGEHRLGWVRLRCYPGSSPLARGTFESLIICRVMRRLIPARAGNIPPP